MGMASLTKDEVEQYFPEAVQFARLMREAFGDDLKMIYAKNANGNTLGRPSTPSTNGILVS